MQQQAQTEQVPGVWQVVTSVAAAFFGVQSSSNRERDFRHGNPWLFMLVGCAMTAAVVLGFYLAVRLVLATAG